MYPLHPEPSSHLPPHLIPPGCHRALALGALRHASDSHWLSISHMVTYMTILCAGQQRRHGHKEQTLGLREGERKMMRLALKHTHCVFHDLFYIFMLIPLLFISHLQFFKSTHWLI